MFAPKNILVPTDFSQHSDAALREAVDIAVQNGAKTHLLHVITEHVQQCGDDYCLSDELVNQFNEESLKGAMEKLEREAVAIAKDRDVKISFDIKHGVPHEVILNEQEARDIDLIVISSHGKTGLLKSLMGGVADKVIRGAKCTVIVIKP